MEQNNNVIQPEYLPKIMWSNYKIIKWKNGNQECEKQCEIFTLQTYHLFWIIKNWVKISDITFFDKIKNISFNLKIFKQYNIYYSITFYYIS